MAAAAAWLALVELLSCSRHKTARGWIKWTPWNPIHVLILLFVVKYSDNLLRSAFLKKQQQQ